MDGDDRFSSEKSDVDVISKIYELYAPRMRRMAYHMLRDYHRAEDAVHIVFAAMLKNRDKLVFDVESKATRTYLCTAVRRTVYNMQRDNKKYKLADEEDENDHFFRYRRWPADHRSRHRGGGDGEASGAAAPVFAGDAFKVCT